MFGLIISLLIIGLIAGALARLIVPGKQDLSIPATIVIGVIGSFLGGFLGYVLLGHHKHGGFVQPSGIIGSAIGSVIVLLVWLKLSRRSHTSIDVLWPVDDRTQFNLADKPGFRWRGRSPYGPFDAPTSGLTRRLLDSQHLAAVAGMETAAPFWAADDDLAVGRASARAVIDSTDLVREEHRSRRHRYSCLGIPVSVVQRPFIATRFRQRPPPFGTGNGFSRNLEVPVLSASRNFLQLNLCLGKLVTSGTELIVNGKGASLAVCFALRTVDQVAVVFA